MKEAVVVRVDRCRPGGEAVGNGGCNTMVKVAVGAVETVDAGGAVEAGEDLEEWLT